MSPVLRRLAWLLIGGLIAWKVGLDLGDVLAPVPYRAGPEGRPNRLRLGAHGLLADIPVHPPAELDGRSRADLLAARVREVDRFPQLLEDPYRPYAPVFQAIGDGLPWWGAVAVDFARVPVASDGVSDQAPFFLNPFLLVGLRDGINPQRGREPPDAQPFPPEIRRVQWTLGPSPMVFEQIDVSANVAGGVVFDASQPRTYELEVYNARDFGFRTLAVERAGTRNVSPWARFGRRYRLDQALRARHACGALARCNDVWPARDELWIRVDALPASFTVHLWQALPPDAGRHPDLTVLVELPAPSGP